MLIFFHTRIFVQIDVNDIYYAKKNGVEIYFVMAKLPNNNNNNRRLKRKTFQEHNIILF